MMRFVHSFVLFNVPRHICKISKEKYAVNKSKRVVHQQKRGFSMNPSPNNSPDPPNFPYCFMFVLYLLASNLNIKRHRKNG